MSLPEKIRELRLRRSWSQQTVADKLNISRSVITKYELGQQPIKDEMIVRLAELFNVPVRYLTDDISTFETGKEDWTSYRTGSADMQIIQELLQKNPKLKKSLLKLDQYPLKEQQKAGEFLETFVSGLRKSR